MWSIHEISTHFIHGFLALIASKSRPLPSSSSSDSYTSDIISDKYISLEKKLQKNQKRLSKKNKKIKYLSHKVASYGEKIYQLSKTVKKITKTMTSKKMKDVLNFLSNENFNDDCTPRPLSINRSGVVYCGTYPLGNLLTSNNTNKVINMVQFVDCGGSTFQQLMGPMGAPYW